MLDGLEGVRARARRHVSVVGVEDEEGIRRVRHPQAGDPDSHLCRLCASHCRVRPLASHRCGACAIRSSGVIRSSGELLEQGSELLLLLRQVAILHRLLPARRDGQLLVLLLDLVLRVRGQIHLLGELLTPRLGEGKRLGLGPGLGSGLGLG